MRDLFKLLVDEDYYKPTLAKTGYDNNYTQYESKGDKILTLEEYLALIEQYLKELINYCKNKGEWKVQLIADINFISLKPGSDETRVMYTKSDNTEIRIGDDINDVIKELFKSFFVYITRVSSEPGFKEIKLISAINCIFDSPLFL